MRIEGTDARDHETVLELKQGQPGATMRRNGAETTGAIGRVHVYIGMRGSASDRMIGGGLRGRHTLPI